MKPDLSVIIPTYNRGKIFTETLSALCDALTNINSEIIVVNDHKETTLKIEPQRKEIKVVVNPKQGAASARNYGFAASTGRLVLFLDDDMIVSEKVISELMTFTLNNNKKILSPNWEYPLKIADRLKEGKFGRFLLNINYNNLKGWINSDIHWKDKEVFRNNGLASYCLIMKREDFITFGGYNESFSFAGFEDYDLTKRFEKMLFTFYIDPSLIIYHNEADRLELSGWLKRKRRNGSTQRNAVEIGYSEMKITYHGAKLIMIKIAWKLKSTLLLMAKLIPNVKLFDPAYLFFVKILTGLYIYAGYNIDYDKR